MHHIRGLEFCIWDYDTLIKIKKKETCEGNKKNTSFLFFFFNSQCIWERLGWEKVSNLMVKHREN